MTVLVRCRTFFVRMSSRAMIGCALALAAGLMWFDGARANDNLGSGGLPQAAIILTQQASSANPNVVYVGTAKHGVLRSTDHGQTFQQVNRGLPPAVGQSPVGPVTQLVVDPRDANVAYVSTEVDGIYKTTDGGQFWSATNRGLPGKFQYRTYHPLLAIDRTQPDTLYAVVGYPVHSHLIRNRVYRSTDGGDHWAAIEQLPDNMLFQSVSIIPGEIPELEVRSGERAIRVKDTGNQLEADPTWLSKTPASPGATLNTDIGEITVIEDDGTMVRNFDLANRSFEFVPQTTPGYRAVEIPAAVEADMGTRSELTDDGSLSLPMPFPFMYYGFAPTTLFINSNGHVTFNSPDSAGTPSPTLNFSSFRLGPPKISALWTNLDPSAGGGVFIKTATDPARLVITWDRVPQLGLPDSNTFQVVLFSDGRIRLNYGRVQAASALVGLSPGRTLVAPTLVNFSRDLPQTVETRAVLEYFSGEGLDFQSVAQKFYQTRQDRYDQLLLFGSSAFRSNLAGGPFVVGFHVLIQNDVRGIGLPVGEFSGGPAGYGSAGRLQGVINLNTLAIYPDDPNQEIGATLSPLDVMTHEVVHRWLTYILFDKNGRPNFDLLRTDLTHWSFFVDTDASVMFGNRWRDNGDGTFTTIGATEGYGPLDLYAMGLRPMADTESFFYVANASNTTVTRDNLPEVGVTVAGTRADVAVEQITSINGPRVPGFGKSPTSLNQAFVLVVPEGQTASAADLAKLDRFRQAFAQRFNQITGRRAVADTRLNPGTADLQISNLIVTQPVLTPGGTAAATFTITNQGTAAAGLGLHELRLSATVLIDENDPVLKKLTSTSLEPGESTTFTNVPVTLPATASSGPQFITVAINAGGTVRESDLGNNQAAMPVTVINGGAPLTRLTETENNDQAARATAIMPDTLITGAINPARDVDFFSFTATAGQIVTVDTNAQSLSPSSPANTIVSVLDSTGAVLAENDDFAGSTDSFLQVAVPRSGQYFLRIQNVPSQLGGQNYVYQAVVTKRSNIPLAESEQNNSFTQANLITSDVIITGAINPAGDEDYFLLNAGAGQVLRVEVAAQSLNPPSPVDTIVSVFDQAGSLIAENDDSGGSADSTVQVAIPRAGPYFIRIRDVAGRGGAALRYRATVRLVSIQTMK